MRSHISNIAYGLLDYAAYPAAMLIAAPELVHHLGTAKYGIWLIASAAVGAGSLVSSGFGDAVIQRVASLRASNDHEGIRRIIGNMLGLNLMLGTLLAMVLWVVIPFIAARIAHFDPTQIEPSKWSLRVGALLIVLKSIESVFISAQRAFESYAPAARIALAAKVLAVLIAVVLARNGYGVPALMVGTCLVVAFGMICQRTALQAHLGARTVKAAFDRDTFFDLISFGGFTWLQAVAGVLFSQADRLLLGITIGASAVAYYGVSVQMAQPIHGLTAAGLHFLFPHLSTRFAASRMSGVRRPILIALALNVGAALALLAGVMLIGPRLLRLWMGKEFADQSAGILPLLAIGFCFLAFNVTGHYALLAIGKVRLVTALNVAGGTAMLFVMAFSVPDYGVRGAAWGRLCYGVITCFLYIPLFRQLRNSRSLPALVVRVATEEA